MNPNGGVPSEHIRLLERELEGKVRATGEYDSIIWRIRTGYLAVLYGVLGLLVGTEGIRDVQAIATSFVAMAVALLAITGFSLSGFLIDFVYSRSKLRVVVARDALLRRFVRLTGPSPIEDFGRLLRLSGEDPALFERMLHPREERRDFKDDEALRQELIAEYRRRRNQNLCVLTCFYLIAPTVGILMVVIAFTD